ncbi:REP-associated tyrosine transposase [Lysobacter sp. A289]
MLWRDVGRVSTRHREPRVTVDVGLKPDLQQGWTTTHSQVHGGTMAYTDLRRGRVSQPGLPYHITTVTRDRLPHFASLDSGRKVVRELMALQNEGRAETLCYVVMPDHLHWLMVLHEGKLSDAVRLLKGRTARTIGHGVWQPNYFDHAVRRDEQLRAIARYIVANPLRAGLVKRIGDYPLWDAIWIDETLSG